MPAFRELRSVVPDDEVSPEPARYSRVPVNGTINSMPVRILPTTFHLKRFSILIPILML